MDGGRSAQNSSQAVDRRRKKRHVLLLRSLNGIIFVACLAGFGILVQDHLIKFFKRVTSVSVVYKPTEGHEVRCF